MSHLRINVDRRTADLLKQSAEKLNDQNSTYGLTCSVLLGGEGLLDVIVSANALEAYFYFGVETAPVLKGYYERTRKM